MCVNMGLFSTERIEAEVAFLSSEEFWQENPDNCFGEDPFMEDYECNGDNYYNEGDECNVF